MRGLIAGLVVPLGALVQMIVLPPGAESLIVTPEMRLAWAIVLAASCMVAGAVLVRFLGTDGGGAVRSPLTQFGAVVEGSTPQRPIRRPRPKGGRDH